ncbi:MAG: DUF4258 domain-containing protein [Candidatus Aenigmatarchaeota archaeon]
MKDVLSDKDAMKISRRITRGSINFSSHYRVKAEKRNIDEGEILKAIKDVDSIILIEDQGLEPKGHKYLMLLQKSSRYDMRIIISIKKDKINIVTAHIQNKRRRKVYEKWLKQR